MDTIEQVTQIAGRRPCREAREWLATQPDAATAWINCEHADWLLWLAGYGGADRRALVLAACDCAETALRYVPEGEERPRVAIETARRWARGEATATEVESAFDAVYLAYRVARIDERAHRLSIEAVTCAVYAALVDDIDAYAVTAAVTADAAACANDDAAACANDDAVAAHRAMCDLIRRRWPTLADALPHTEVE